MDNFDPVSFLMGAKSGGGGGGGDATQLAYAETGTTATREYVDGDYISMGGELLRAITTIQIGAPLSAGENGNCKAVTAGGFNNYSISGDISKVTFDASSTSAAVGFWVDEPGRNGFSLVSASSGYLRLYQYTDGSYTMLWQK